MQYTERVIRGDDGVYRWKITLTRSQALVHFRSMVVICTVIATVITLIMVALLGLEHLWYTALILYGGIVALPALCFYLTLSWDTRSYEMDGTCIRHKHATKGGDAVVHFEKVKRAWAQDNALKLKEGVTTYTVYVPREDLAFVKNYVGGRMPSGEIVW